MNLNALNTRQHQESIFCSNISRGSSDTNEPHRFHICLHNTFMEKYSSGCVWVMVELRFDQLYCDSKWLFSILHKIFQILCFMMKLSSHFFVVKHGGTCLPSIQSHIFNRRFKDHLQQSCAALFLLNWDLLHSMCIFALHTKLKRCTKLIIQSCVWFDGTIIQAYFEFLITKASEVQPFKANLRSKRHFFREFFPLHNFFFWDARALMFE